MKEIKTLNQNSTYDDFVECYKHNSELIGNMTIRPDVYAQFIKIITVFPLNSKMLKYFLSLSSKSKVGYMSSYIMKIARLLKIPDYVIKNFQTLKEKKRLYKTKPSAKDVGDAYVNDMKTFFNLYENVIKHDIYTDELSKATINLCSEIFKKYYSLEQ